MAILAFQKHIFQPQKNIFAASTGLALLFGCSLEPLESLETLEPQRIVMSCMKHGTVAFILSALALVSDRLAKKGCQRNQAFYTDVFFPHEGSY